MLILTGCSVFSYDPCAEKYPRNKHDQENCKESRQKDMRDDSFGAQRGRMGAGLSF